MKNGYAYPVLEKIYKEILISGGFLIYPDMRQNEEVENRLRLVEISYGGDILFWFNVVDKKTGKKRISKRSDWTCRNIFEIFLDRDFWKAIARIDPSKRRKFFRFVPRDVDVIFENEDTAVAYDYFFDFVYFSFCLDCDRRSKRTKIDEYFSSFLKNDKTTRNNE